MRAREDMHVAAECDHNVGPFLPLLEPAGESSPAVASSHKTRP
jgi:hypothetical protein